MATYITEVYVAMVTCITEMAERHDVSEVLKLARALVQKLQQLAENK